MRASHLVISLFSAGVFGCSSSSGPPTLLDAPPVDTPPPVDAFACAQRGTVNTTMPVDFSVGGGQAQGVVPASGTELTVSAIITNNAAPTTGLLMIQVNNAGVYGAAAGAAGRFEKPPTPGSYPLDPDANLGFGIDFVNGITHNANGTASINPTQVAVLDSAAGGTVTIDTWTPAATQGGTSTIAATITNAKFKGFNILPTGALDSTGNGCDVTIQRLQFIGLSVKWQTTAFPMNIAPPLPPQGFAARSLDAAVAVSADLRVEP